MIGDFAGVVLAAGRSSRMGRDKALLEVDGLPLWARQRDLLRGVGASEIFLSARVDQGWAETATGFSAIVRDAVPEAGPLAGIVAAMQAMSRTPASHLIVLAIDLPRVTTTWFDLLRERGAPGLGAVGRRGAVFEPLAAFYPRELAPDLGAALAAGEWSLQLLLARFVSDGRMLPHSIEANEIGTLFNWNEPSL